MSDHISVVRMNDAVDGLLPARELEELRRHVLGCPTCREDYARISETVAGIRALPRSASPPTDTWAGIADRLSQERSEPAVDPAKVIELPIAGAAERARRVSFTVPQLAAAAIVVSVLSAGSVWAVLGAPDGIGSPGEERTALPGGAAVRAVSDEGGRYQEVVDQLQEVLEEGRGVLEPATLETIEASLATVDEAIEEIERALSADPGSDLLRRMLAHHRKTRLGVLERAAAAVLAQT